MKVLVGETLFCVIEKSNNVEEQRQIDSDKLYVNFEVGLPEISIKFRRRLVDLSKVDFPTINGFCGDVVQLVYEFTGDKDSPYRLHQVNGTKL